MCTPVQNAGTHVPQEQFVPQLLFLHCCSLPIYRKLSVGLCAPLPALFALGLFSFCHALPTAGLQRHTIPFGSGGEGQVGGGQEVLLSKEECPRRCGVRQDLKGLFVLSFLCSWVSLLTTHPTTSSLQINSKEVHMSEVVQYNGSQRHPTNVRYVWYQPLSSPCMVTAPSFLCVSHRRTTHLESKRARINAYWVVTAKAEDKKKVVKKEEKEDTERESSSSSSSRSSDSASGSSSGCALPPPPLPL